MKGQCLRNKSRHILGEFCLLLRIILEVVYIKQITTLVFYGSHSMSKF